MRFPWCSARPVVSRVTPGSVLHTTSLPPYYIGTRPRLATCGGVAWFHGHHLATLNLADAAVHVYRFDPGARRLTLLQHLPRLAGLEEPENLEFSPDGDKLVISSGVHGVHVYAVDAATHRIAAWPEAQVACAPSDNTHGVACSPCGRVLLISTVDVPGTLTCYRTGDGYRVLQRLESAHGELTPKGVAFTPDGRHVVISHGPTAHDRPVALAAEAFIEVRAFDAARGLSPEPVAVSAPGLGLGCAEDVAITADGRIFVTDQARDRVERFRWDGALRHVPSRGFAGLSFPHGTAVSDDGRFLAVANYGSDRVTVFAT